MLSWFIQLSSRPLFCRMSDLSDDTVPLHQLVWIVSAGLVTFVCHMFIWHTRSIYKHFSGFLMSAFPHLIFSFLILLKFYIFLPCFYSFILFFSFSGLSSSCCQLNGNPEIISAGVMHFAVFHIQSDCMWPGFYELRAWYINNRRADQGVRRLRTKCGQVIWLSVVCDSEYKKSKSNKDLINPLEPGPFFVQIKERVIPCLTTKGYSET